MSASDQPENPAEALLNAALLADEWPAGSRRSIVTYGHTAFKMPPKGTYEIIIGFAGGPAVVYGGYAPCRCSSATDSPREHRAANAESPWMTMDEVADHIRKGYSWVSKHWKTTMRLSRHGAGKPYVFSREEVDAWLGRYKRRPTDGRRKRIIGVING